MGGVRRGDAPGRSVRLLGLGALATVAAYGVTSLSVLDQDVFVMAEIAQRVLRGDALYGNAWDNKPPLCLLVYALPQLVAPGSYGAIQLTLGLWVCVQAALWLRFAPGPWLLRAGGAASLALFPLSNFHFAWFSSEDTVNLFAVALLLGAYRAVDARHASRPAAFAMGAALVLGFHARQTMVCLAPVALWAIATSDDPRAAKARALVAFALGALSAWAAVLALVLWVGDVRGYLDAVFVHARAYRGSAGMLIDLVSAFRGDVTTFVLFAAAGYLMTRPQLRGFALLSLAGTVAAVLLPRRAHLHYWEQFGPTLVLLVHMAVRDLLAADRRWQWVMVGVLPGFLLMNAGWTVLKCFVGRDAAPIYAAAEEIDALAAEGERLLVLGPDAGPLYYATRMPHANTFFWEFYLYGCPEVLPKPLGEIVREYERMPPEILVVGGASRRRVEGPPSPDDDVVTRMTRALLRQNRYEPLALATGAAVDVTALRLARPAPPGRAITDARATPAP